MIIGGVAGGATAAARIRRADGHAQIVLIEKGEYISYANCGLPYYIGGVIAGREKLFLQTPASFGTRFDIDVRVRNRAVGIDTLAKTVLVERADGSRYEEGYDRLLLSPGARAVRPPLPGIDLPGIFTLRDVVDTDRIKEYIASRGVKRAVVVGAGFIGLEMAENLHHAGAAVSIVEMAGQVMPAIDFSMAAPLHSHLAQKGVELHLGVGVERFSSTDGGLGVHLSDGSALPSDMVILSIGVRPETSLAAEAGLKIGEAGGIWVDEHLQTSAEGVYAVGDAIEFAHPLTGKPWLNFLAGPANRQGRIVADNMVFGNKTAYEGSIGTAVAKVFDMTVASTGLSAKRLQQMGIAFRSSWTHSASHAGYYPDSLPLSIKLTFDPADGRLYGAQCVGYDGVDKRIDLLAITIKRGGTVADLTRIEHAYAPPFSSAKDPVAIAGYVASNIVSGAMPAITWRAVADAKDATLLDVRTPQEFSMGTIAGAVNIPLDSLRERLGEIPAGRPVVVFCAVGLRGYLASRILASNGFTDVKNLSGGYRTYSAATAQIEKPKSRPVMQTPVSETIKIDACGLQCPGPVLRLKQAVDGMQPGQRLEMVATDAGFARDAGAWCSSTGNTLISTGEQRGKYTVVIEKGVGSCLRADMAQGGRGKTLIMFSDDLDRALATMVLANGAAATGEKVTIFFTFWGLNVIKKTRKPRVEKDIFGKMFGMMLPGDSLGLKLSKMHMMGLGSRMMRLIMKRKGISSLETLRDQAVAQGVEFIACQMSMDVMGVKKEELLDGVTIGGVATYMERADKANVNLFI